MSRRDSFGRQVLRGVLHGPANLTPEPEPVPIDWPARFRAAADVATEQGWATGLPDYLQAVARELEEWSTTDEVEAIGRALLGEGS